MTRIILYILALITNLTAKADSYGLAYQYDKYSENGKFYFNSIPFHHFGGTNFGKTIVYDSKTQEQLYKIDYYLSEAFISNSGRTLVSTEFWMSGHSNLEDQLLVEIFINGESSAKYYIDDFVVDKSKLELTESHTLWRKELFVIDDTLFIRTLENKVVSIELTTGKIVNKDTKYNRSPPQNSTNTIYYRDIKYHFGGFPDLISGKKFKESLILYLGKTEVEMYEDCNYYISVQGVIDKLGNCEIFWLRTSVNREEDKDWDRKVSDWVTNQKYEVNLIPKNCDKWVFEEYFYLK